MMARIFSVSGDTKCDLLQIVTLNGSTAKTDCADRHGNDDLMCLERGDAHMKRPTTQTLVLAAFLAAGLTMAAETASAQNGYSQGQRAYGQTWGGQADTRDWNRFYHYPYVYYPQNFWGQEYFRSSDSLYHRYPQEMRIPVYNKKWHNFYPSSRRYHSGHHFMLDVF